MPGGPSWRDACGPGELFSVCLSFLKCEAGTAVVSPGKSRGTKEYKEPHTQGPHTKCPVNRCPRLYLCSAGDETRASCTLGKCSTLSHTAAPETLICDPCLSPEGHCHPADDISRWLETRVWHGTRNQHQAPPRRPEGPRPFLQSKLGFPPLPDTTYPGRVFGKSRWDKVTRRG